jgi:RHS repeat-associated protein
MGRRRLSALVVAVLSMQVAAVVAAAPAGAADPVAPPAAVNPAPVVRTVMTPGPTVMDGVKITTDTVWGPEGSPYVIRGQLTIEEQASLTLLPGPVLKMDGQLARVVAHGQLLSLGTPDRRVVITSYKDDTVLGDTNGDAAASTPARGDWYSIRGAGSSISNRTVVTFDYTDFRWGGYGSGGMCGGGKQLDLSDSTRAVVSNSSFTEAQNNGIQVTNIGPNGFVGIYGNFFDRSGCGMYTQMSSQVEVVGNTFGASFSKWPFMSNTSYRMRLWFNTFSGKPAVIGSTQPTRAAADVRYNSFLAGVDHWYPSWQDLGDWSQNWWGYNVNTFALPACATVAQAAAATPPWSLNTSSPCGDSTSAYPVTGYAKPVLPALSGAPGTVPGGVNEASAPRYGPVDTRSGALSYQASDLVVQDAGKQVTATRSYRSDVTSGDLGSGWTSAFSEALSTANGTATMSTSDGRSIAFGTDPAAGYVPAPGVSAGFSSDAGGSQVTTPGQDTFRFDPDGALTGMLLGDPGHELDISRSGGQLDRVTGVSGRFLAYTRHDGKLRSVNDSTGRSVGFAYSDGRLAAASGADGETETYSYDGGGRLTRVTTPSGRTKLAAGYGADGKVTWVEQEGTGRSTFHYDTGNRRTTIDLPDGSHVEQSYDTSGRLITDQVLGGSGRHVVYDGEGRAVVVVSGVPTVPMTGYGPAANTTFFDGNGDPAMKVDPQGVMARTTFSAHKPLVTTYGDGTTITRTYDGAGRLATVTDQRGKLWRYTFNNRGQATGRTDPLGRNTGYTYAANGDRAGVTDETGASTTYDNDAQGRPTAVTDPLGRRRTIAYTAWDEPQRITQPRGGVYAITFDADRRKTASSDPTGATSRYEYDAAGRLSASIDPSGGRTAVEYDAVGRPTRITDPRGGVITRQYSVEGWPTRITDQAGAVTLTEYDPAGRTIRITDALGQVTQTVYDRAGRAVKAQTPDGATRSSSYDVMGRLSQSTTPLGRKWLQAYDTAGNPTVTTDPAGRTIVVGHDDLGRPVSRTDQAGVVSTIAYDDATRTTTVTDPLGVLQAARTDAAGQLVTATDGRGAGTVREYDADGNLAVQTDPTGGATTYGHDLAGRATSTTDPLGRTATGEYDSLGRLTKRTWPDTTTETFAYDPVGNLTRHTDRTGAAWTYDFDAANHVSSAKDPLGNQTTYTHDALGRLTRTTDPTGGVEATGYDPVARPAVRSDATGASWVNTYDLDGNVLTSTDPAGVKVTSAYDTLGRLTKITANGSPREITLDAVGRVISYDDEFNQVSTFEYDVRGRRTAAVDPLRQRTTYAYDGAGNLLTETPPGGHAQTRSYDLAGRVGTAADALGNTSRYTYNAAGELTALKLPRGGVYTYTYDAAGRTSSETDPRGAITRYAYDGEGRPTSTTRPSGKIVTNSYDAAGRRTQSVAGTDTRSYGYDTAGRITSAGNLGFGYDNRGLLTRSTDAGGDTTYAYDAARRLSARTPPGGVTTTFAYGTTGTLSQVRGGTNLNYTYDYSGRGVTRAAVSPTTGNDTRSYDAALRPTEVRSGNSAFKVSAQYSPDGQISSLTQTAPGNAASNTTAFGYDDAGRLTSAGTATFGWDADGNRTSASGVTADHDAANRLTGTSDGGTYGYDADGNLTDVTRPGGSTHYDYNAFGELVSASNGTVTVTYGRDALGRTSSSGSSQLSYDGSSTQLSQYRSGSAKTDLVREPTGGLLAETTQAGGSSRVWQTLHGDLGMLANAATGAVQHTAVYGPFGNATTTGSAPVPLGFQSMLTDSVTGLVDMGARGYDAVTGRFTQVDTVVGDLTSPVTLNRYTYGNADPLNHFDPDGHWSIPGWDAVKSFVSTAVNWVSDRVDEAASWVTRTAEQVGNSVVDAVSTVFPANRATAGGGSAQVAQRNEAPWLTDVLRAGFQLAHRPNAVVATVVAAAIGASPLAHLNLGWSDVGHTALDLAGLVPVIGEAADLANAAWYAADGDHLNAGLSAAAAIPFLGWGATGTKLAIKGTDAVRSLVKASDETAAVVKGSDEAAAVVKGADEAAPVVPSLKPPSAKAGSSSPGAPPKRDPIFADADLMVNAQKGNQKALAEIRAGTTYVTPNQYREFLAGGAGRREFMQQEGIELFGGARAAQVAGTPRFQTAFNSVVRAQGRGDAALCAFACATGYTAVTMEKRLFNFVKLTLRNSPIPIRRVMP